MRAVLLQIFILSFGLTQLAPRLAIGGTILQHESPSFSLRIPDGFKPSTAPQLAQTLYSFNEPSDGVNPRLTFNLIDMGKPFLPRRITQSDAKRIFNDDASVEYWKYRNLTLSTVVSTSAIGRFKLINLTIQIPFRERGVQLCVTASKSREGDARRLLKQLLASLDGPLISEPVEVLAFQPTTGARRLFANLGLSGVGLFVLYGIFRIMLGSGERRRVAFVRMRISALLLIIVLLVPTALYRLTDMESGLPYAMQISAAMIYMPLAAWAFLIFLGLKRLLMQSHRVDSNDVDHESENPQSILT